jgi:hypothetical protein
MWLRISWVFVVGGRLRRPCRVGCSDFGVCCRNRASLGATYGCCSGEVGCGKQKPQADGEVGYCGGREGGSPAPAGGGEEGREQGHCRCACCSSRGQTCAGGGQSRPPTRRGVGGEAQPPAQPRGQNRGLNARGGRADACATRGRVPGAGCADHRL